MLKYLFSKVSSHCVAANWLFATFTPITENDPEEQDKRVKYLDLVASAVILHNAVDPSLLVQELSAEGGEH